MAQARGVVESSMKSIERSANVAKSALAALGVGLSAGGFAYLVKGTIDAADHLNDLSKATSIAVEELAGLKLAAKQSGGDLDSIAQAINKLSVNMGKDAQSFKDLGISAKDPLEAFKQLSDLFVAIQDPQQRAAVMAAALGKTWAGAAPLLAEGGAKIGEMVARGTQLSGVTKEMAEEADRFNDKLVELVGSGGLMVRMVGPALPLLNDLADGMLKAGDGADGLKTAMSPLAEVLKTVVVLGANVGFVFTTMGKDMARAVENVKLIATGDWAGSRALGEAFRKDAEAARKALDEYSARVMGMGLTGKSAPVASIDPAVAAAAKARAEAFLRAQAAAAGDRGKTAADLLNESAGVNKDFFKDLSTLHAEYARGGLTIDQYREAVERLIEKQQFSRDAARNEEEARKAANQAAEAYAKQNDRQIEVIQEVTQSLRQRAGEIEAETSLVGASAAERERANEFLKIENQLRKASIDLTPDQVSALRDLAEAEKSRIGAAIDAKVAREEAVKAAEDAAKEWKNTFDRRSDALTRTISDGLMRGFEKGAKSGAEVVIDTLKNALKTAVFEPVIHALVSPVSRAVTGATMGLFGGAASASGSVGGGGGLGNLLSGASTAYNAATGQGIFGALGLGGSGFSVGSAAGSVAQIGIADSWMLGGLEAGGALSAIPGWGWALGGAALLGGALGLFGGGGGPKPGEVMLTTNGRVNGKTNYWLGNNNLPGGNDAANEAYLAQISAELNDPAKYDQGVLASLVGTSVSGVASAQDGAAKLLQSLAPAAQAAQGKSTARSALLAAQDPAGYWRGQVETLDSALGTSAKTLEQWRAEFLAALDGPLSADQLAKWQALGDAINNAANAAGAAAAQISPREFSTLVDYRRAVRLAGGVPKFAAGGAFGGGVRLVGEMGPELELTGPSRIISNAETRRLLDLSGVEDRLGRLETALHAIALHTSRSARLLDRFDGDGMPVRGVDPTVPLEVQVAP